MLTNLIVLPDGTELYHGVRNANAIFGLTTTECVNSGSELMLGSVCSTMLEARIFAQNGDLHISTGTEITLYKVDDTGARTKVGLFTLEKPERNNAHAYKITAYDRVSRLDRNLAPWLNGLTEWPYTMFAFAQMVCAQCGLTLANDSLPCGDFQIRKFSAGEVTGRQLMSWVGEANAKFCRATPDGEIEFAWYVPAAAQIAPVRSAGTYGYYQGSLSYSDYSVTPIEKVQIRFSDEDVGAIYPNDAAASNTYRITGNYLLLTDTTDRLLPIAQNIYQALKEMTYVPGKVSIPSNLEIRAGNIVTVTDANDNELKIYVMQRKQAGTRDTLECTGSQSRDSVTQVNNQGYRALNGKVLKLIAAVDGLQVENADTAGRVASLGLEVDGISAQVSRQTQRQDEIDSRMTQLRQDAESFGVTIQHILDNGVDKVTTETGYTFNADGLRITKSGEQMENKLDNTGMYVMRSGDTILEANDKGVNARDVTVQNYLVIGHLRFEQTGDATSIFYV